ncbi:MAG: cell envelope integrity protein TolA [Pseudomonadota bacterium]
MSWYPRFIRFLSDSVLPWLGAVAVHALVLVALVFSLGWRHQATPAVASGGPTIEAIEAVVVDSAMLDAEVRRLADLEQARLRAQAAEAQAIRDSQARAEQAAREQAQRTEQARLVQLQREADAKRAAQEQAAREAQARREARAKAEAEAEAQRLAEERRKEEQRLAQERRRAQEKRREEQRQAEERRRAEQARAAQQQKEAEQLLLAALAEEEDRQAKVNAGLLAQYKAQVKQKVERNWARPPDAEAGLSCEVNVRQLRDGQVIKVEFGRCNGNDAVKRSIEGAVNRASPLPPPPDPSLFDEYLVFIFEPE